ncbi:fluoride efflux transporter CrcB [Kiloniella antarctica]|uniref:Fluoride-specific ion channel FluC n=1 Tax=Kiloniella antarctica TaxID=1550907 RepID=A0ABW5BIE9_9PROT
MKMLAAVALGGALGAMGRYLVFTVMGSLVGTMIPTGTLTVNVVGSFFMGILVPWIGAGGIASPEMRALLTVGLLGAFTTFSTFSMDVVVLIQRDAIGLAVLYLCLSVFLSIAAFIAGYYLMRSFVV